MYKNRLLEKLKRSQNVKTPDDEIFRAMANIQKHERLSSQEFLKVYDTIWQKRGVHKKASARNQKLIVDSLEKVWKTWQ